MSNTNQQPLADARDIAIDLDSLLYSRTDERGHIQSVNAEFQATVGMDWPDLLGASQDILRNTDTPSGVFRHVWGLLDAGKPSAAYLRNSDNDGRGYWVIALFVPTGTGHISVQFKPASPLFGEVKAIYARITAAEKADNLKPEDSEAQLLAELAALGFETYHDFQTAALAGEFRARSLGLGPKLKGYFADVDRVATALNAIKSAQVGLVRDVEALRDLPTNMRIVASRQEPSGGPLSAMSDIYNATSSVLFQEISEFALGKISASRQMGAAFQQSCFVKIVNLLMEEVAASALSYDLAEHGIDLPSEDAVLRTVLTQCMTQEREAFEIAESLAQDLNRASYDLRRSMLGLDTIRVMGLVESGRLGTQGSRIAATMDQIGISHRSIISLLQGIKDSATVVNSGVLGLRAHLKSRRAMAAN